MSIETIHLTTSEVFQQQAEIGLSQQIVDAFIRSCLALDASIFEPFIDENTVFELKNKYLFLARLKTVFDSWKGTKQIHEIKVTVWDNHCYGCSLGKPIKFFNVEYGSERHDLNQFAFVIDMENGTLKDIYKCNWGFREFAKLSHKAPR